LGQTHVETLPKPPKPTCNRHEKKGASAMREGVDKEIPDVEGQNTIMG
jgi:hypothetical protein